MDTAAETTPTSTTIHKRRLQESPSSGNLTATTAEGTDSFSIAGYVKNDGDKSNDNRLTVFQLDHGSISSAKGETRWEVGNASVSQELDSMNVSVGLSEAEASRLPLPLPGGIPTEVILLHENADETHRDMHKTTMLKFYRDKLHAANSENEALSEFLKQTQEYAEELLSERKELVQVIEELENESSERNDQELLLKVIVLFSLGVYACGGSPEFLAAAVVLQLFVTLVNLVL